MQNSPKALPFHRAQPGSSQTRDEGTHQQRKDSGHRGRSLCPPHPTWPLMVLDLHPGLWAQALPGAGETMTLQCLRAGPQVAGGGGEDPGLQDRVPERGRGEVSLHRNQPVLVLLGPPSVLEHPTRGGDRVGTECGSHSRTRAQCVPRLHPRPAQPPGTSTSPSTQLEGEVKDKSLWPRVPEIPSSQPQWFLRANG